MLSKHDEHMQELNAYALTVSNLRETIRQLVNSLEGVAEQMEQYPRYMTDHILETIGEGADIPNIAYGIRSTVAELFLYD